MRQTLQFVGRHVGITDDRELKIISLSSLQRLGVHIELHANQSAGKCIPKRNQTTKSQKRMGAGGIAPQFLNSGTKWK
jgi:hypothetical protein